MSKYLTVDQCYATVPMLDAPHIKERCPYPAYDRGLCRFCLERERQAHAAMLALNEKYLMKETRDGE